jgi:hypothetical protein
MDLVVTVGCRWGGGDEICRLARVGFGRVCRGFVISIICYTQKRARVRVVCGARGLRFSALGLGGCVAWREYGDMAEHSMQEIFDISGKRKKGHDKNGF